MFLHRTRSALAAWRRQAGLLYRAAQPTRSFAVKRRLAGRSAYLRPHRTVRASRTCKSGLNNPAREIEHPFFNFNYHSSSQNQGENRLILK